MVFKLRSLIDFISSNQFEYGDRYCRTEWWWRQADRGGRVKDNVVEAEMDIEEKVTGVLEKGKRRRGFFSGWASNGDLVFKNKLLYKIRVLLSFGIKMLTLTEIIFLPTLPHAHVTITYPLIGRKKLP